MASGFVALQSAVKLFARTLMTDDLRGASKPPCGFEVGEPLPGIRRSLLGKGDGFLLPACFQQMPGDAWGVRER